MRCTGRHRAVAVAQRWLCLCVARMKRVRGLVETAEPLLRRVAGQEIVTTAPLDEVVSALLRVAGVEASREQKEEAPA